MKKLIIIIATITSITSFAYEDWYDFTPKSIISKVNTLSTGVTLRTKGDINTCNMPFEGNKFRVEVLSCDKENLGLKIQYKNNATCDAGKTIHRKLKVKLSKECKRFLWVDYGAPSITINGKLFENH